MTGSPSGPKSLKYPKEIFTGLDSAYDKKMLCDSAPEHLKRAGTLIHVLDDSEGQELGAQY